FFFFQAEDGIRDFHVTGVQTCALPISPARCCWWACCGRARCNGPAGRPAASSRSGLRAAPGRRTVAPGQGRRAGRRNLTKREGGPDGQGPAGYRGTARVQLLLVIALLFALAVAVFAVQNAESISFRLCGWQSETSLVFVVLAAAAAGAVAAGLVGLVKQIKSSLRIRQLQHRLQKAEQ